MRKCTHLRDKERCEREAEEDLQKGTAAMMNSGMSTDICVQSREQRDIE
jgi:hypothetical protein